MEPIPHVGWAEEQIHNLVEVAEEADHLLPVKIFRALLEHESGLLNSDLCRPNEEDLFLIVLKQYL